MPLFTSELPFLYSHREWILCRLLFHFGSQPCVHFFSISGSGSCDEAEWVAGFTSVFGGSADAAKKAFARLDSDKSGDISISEVCDFFKEMDSDGMQST